MRSHGGGVRTYGFLARMTGSLVVSSTDTENTKERTDVLGEIMT